MITNAFLSISSTALISTHQKHLVNFENLMCVSSSPTKKKQPQFQTHSNDLMSTHKRHLVNFENGKCKIQSPDEKTTNPISNPEHRLDVNTQNISCEFSKWEV